jgi:PadR family transcriptional regulator PadR
LPDIGAQRIYKGVSGKIKPKLDKKLPGFYIDIQYNKYQYRRHLVARLDDMNYWKSLINIGLSKILILKILSKGPNHGYGILKQLEGLTHDCCTPTFGTIYPILKALTRDGYAHVKEENQVKGAQKRRVYTLTSAGVNAYKVALEAWRSTIPYIHRAIEEKELVRFEKNANHRLARNTKR